MCSMSCSCLPPGRNIDELQEQSQQLLMVIRDLSDQQEQREQEMMDEKYVNLVLYKLMWNFHYCKFLTIVT